MWRIANETKTGTFSMAGSLALLGVQFLVLGILILVLPELLAWLVALALMVSGAIFLSLAWKSRQVRRWYIENREEEPWWF